MFPHFSEHNINVYRFIFFTVVTHHQHLLYFPTRRSSDLQCQTVGFAGGNRGHAGEAVRRGALPPEAAPNGLSGDRKSTRLNSSHVRISFAVFCLTKKSTKTTTSVIAAVVLGVIDRVKLTG